ncbi:hypothetical protein D9611_013019 [Ephemerocybe angulata]|uniref:ATP-dependent DNA helicase n=1 Tax=Ephemerocybe angulata TaxID=980116 RepID=A0A8H5AUP7_9AGAR|nr:hypothetical protein D9611_013019 [Tulosesus angulatus]
MEPPSLPPNPASVLPSNPVPPVAFPTAPVLTVRRARKDVNNEVTTYPYSIDINAWIRDYRYLGVVRRLEASENRLEDPNCVVVLHSFELAKVHIPYFLALELRTLACYHGLRYKGRSKEQMAADLTSHVCDVPCEAIAMTFIKRQHDRAPGTLMTTQDWSSTSSASPLPLQHLQPLSDRQRIQIVKEWQTEMAPQRFLKVVCAVCSLSLAPDKVKTLRVDSIDLSLLRNDVLPTALRPTTYDILNTYEGAILDPCGLQYLDRKGDLHACQACSSDLRKGKMPKFALANWLYYAREHVPGDVQQAFSEMSVFEKALICRVRTNSLLCRFSGIEDDITDSELFVKGRRHIKGNVISTPLDVMKVNDVLPPSPASVADIMCALIVSASAPTQDTIDRLKPIMVSKSRVKRMISFLVQNNPHYRVSEGFKGFSSEYLDALFTGSRDSGVPASVTIGHIPINQALESLTDDYSGRMDDLDGIFMENVSYTLGDRSATSYRDMAFQAIEHCKAGKPFLYSRAGSDPVPDINNPNWLSWAHPNADPFGLGGFHDPRRSRPIGMEQQLRHLVSVRDSFFESDPELAFDVYNIIRKAAVNTSLRFTVPLSAYSGLVDDVATLNPTLIALLRDKFRRNPMYEPSTQEEKEIIRVMTSVAPVARNIPGSVAQKIKMRNEIRAMIAQRGSPTLFVTINPSDYHHPLVSVMATRPSTTNHLAELRKLKSSDRAKLALLHPLACAEFFDAMIKAFISIVLRCGSKKGPGIFGDCDAYYGTVETQGRGTLHCHMLIWLRGHLPPEALETALKTSAEYRAALEKWLDSIVDSGFLGTKSRLNTETDGGDKDVIRTGEPHPATIPEPSPKLLSPVAFNKEMAEYVDDLLTRFNWHEHRGTCWKYLRPRDPRSDANCRFGMDGCRVPETKVSEENGTVTIRRRHPRMTHYNPTVTFLLKCNTDIKFIGSGGDAKAFLYYVTDYITKPPLSMHAGLTALSYAIRQGEARGLLSEKAREEQDTRRVMTIAINSMLGHQEISHPQVMSYILGGGEYYTSEQFQAMNWGEVVRFVAAADSNLAAPVEPDVLLNVSYDGGKRTASNQLLDYIYRPDSPPYSCMGLYRHVASTRKALLKSPSVSDAAQVSATAPKMFSSSNHPQFHSHALGMRRSNVVPVLLGPSISRRNGTEPEKEQWARDMCILFCPWRSPSDLKVRDGEFTSWTSTLDAWLPNLDARDKAVIENMSLVAEAKQARDTRPHRKGRAPQEDLLNQLPDLQTTTPAEEGPTANVYVASSASAPLISAGDGLETHETHSRLEALLGPCWTSDIFQRCYPFAKHAGPTQTGQPQDLMQDQPQASSAQVLADEQRTYMRKCKLRTLKDSEESTSRRKKKSKKSTHLPAAEITTLVTRRLPLQAQKGIEKAWDVAQIVAIQRGIHRNPEQLRAFQEIALHAINGGEQLLMYIGGRGGTGKSYLIDTVELLFECLGRSDELRLGAYTGIAASLIGGNTLHSLLSIGSSFGKNPATATKRLSDEWRNVKYLIIDEISMVGAQFLAMVSAKLKLAKGDDHRESLKIFGGISMIFLGDFNQLSPPKEPSVYSHRLVRNPTFLQARDNDGLDALAGAYLWRQVRRVVLLKVSKRQEGDALYLEILDRIRSRSCTDNRGAQIRIQGKTIIEHLRQRELSQVSITEPALLALFNEAPVIVGNKETRDALNAAMLSAHASRLNETVHLYYSVDQIKGQRVAYPASRTLWNLPSSATKDAFGILPLFIGMKVMITENLSVPFKIVNGSEGVITDLRFSTDEGSKRIADIVYVRISGKGCKIQAPGLEPGIVPIFARPTTITKPVRIGDTASSSFSRRQVPLIPAYSYTDYKSQGRTLTRAIVDPASCTKIQGVYVMLSRVKSLAGLLILRPFPASKVLQDMTGELRDEMRRLEELDAAHAASHGKAFDTETLADIVPISLRRTSQSSMQPIADVPMQLDP